LAPSIRILIADDHPVVRAGLAAMLATESDLEVVGMAGTGNETVRLAMELEPDLVLIDLEMPGGGGLEAIERLRDADSAARIIVFTAFAREGEIMGAVKAGARGYLLKGAPREELFRAIRTVHAGLSLVEPAIAAKLLRRVREGERALTDREREVLAHLARGAANKEIARALSLSERTVKFHVGSILAKLEASNRTQAVAKARESGLV
jgi:DNA-binding NarL/FixJ family response regulator